MKHYIKNFETGYRDYELYDKIVETLESIIMSGKYGYYEKSVDGTDWYKIYDLDNEFSPIIDINESYSPDSSIESLFYVSIIPMCCDQMFEFNIPLNVENDSAEYFEEYLDLLRKAREVALSDYNSIMVELISKLKEDPTLEISDEP